MYELGNGIVGIGVLYQMMNVVVQVVSECLGLFEQDQQIEWVVCICCECSECVIFSGEGYQVLYDDCVVEGEYDVGGVMQDGGYYLYLLFVNLEVWGKWLLCVCYGGYFGVELLGFMLIIIIYLYVGYCWCGRLEVDVVIVFFLIVVVCGIWCWLFLCFDWICGFCRYGLF